MPNKQYTAIIILPTINLNCRNNRQKERSLMSVFDDIIIGAKSLTSEFTDKTSKFASISKLRITAAELSGEINKRYEALGRIVYEAQKAENDITEMTAECVKGIDALYTRLDDINAKIATLRDKKYCPSCGAVVEMNSIYCSRCGNRVEKTEKSE